jgi:hypothetical protein
VDQVSWLGRERERTVGVVLIACGAVMLLVTYLGVRNDKYLVSELARIAAGGVGGLELLAVGAVALIVGDLLDEWHKLDRIEAAIDGAGADAIAPVNAIPSGARTPLVAAVGCAAVGAVVIAAAWNRAASVHDPRLGVRALTIGIAGLVGSAAGLAAATFALLRNVRLRESRLLAPWLLADLETRLGVDVRAGAHHPAVPAVDWVITGGVLTRYHVPGCLVLASGGPYSYIPIADVPPELRPCGLCLEENAR